MPPLQSPCLRCLSSQVALYPVAEKWSIKDEHFRSMCDTLMGDIYSRATHKLAKTLSSYNIVQFLFLAHFLFFTFLSQVWVLPNASSQYLLLKNPTSYGYLILQRYLVAGSWLEKQTTVIGSRCYNCTIRSPPWTHLQLNQVWFIDSSLQLQEHQGILGHLSKWC